MELPVIGGRGAATTDALVRAVRKGGVELSRVIVDAEDAVDGATIWRSSGASAVADANCARDVHSPQGMTPAQVLSRVDQSFAAEGGACSMLAPIGAEFSEPWTVALEGAGLERRRRTLLLMGVAVEPPAEVSGVQVVAARALAGDYRSFVQRVEIGRGRDEASARAIAAAEAGFLDADALDVIVARFDGAIVACIGVMTVAEFGIVRGWRAAPDAPGAAREAIIWHLLDLCKRSQFRQIIAAEGEADGDARGVMESIGMKPIAVIETALRPGSVWLA